MSFSLLLLSQKTATTGKGFLESRNSKFLIFDKKKNVTSGNKWIWKKAVLEETSNFVLIP